jgi:hypothetical protein
MHVLPLKNFYLGVNHVALEYERYPMDFREYLEEQRDAREINTLLS